MKAAICSGIVLVASGMVLDTWWNFHRVGPTLGVAGITVVLVLLVAIIIDKVVKP